MSDQEIAAEVDRLVRAAIDDWYSDDDVLTGGDEGLVARVVDVVRRALQSAEPSAAGVERIAAERRFSSRGFRIFHERRREPGERLYGEDAVVSVVESSLAGRGPHVRIYEGPNCVQLSVAEAVAVRDALDTFVTEATGDMLTDPRAVPRPT